MSESASDPDEGKMEQEGQGEGGKQDARAARRLSDHEKERWWCVVVVVVGVGVAVAFGGIAMIGGGGGRREEVVGLFEMWAWMARGSGFGSPHQRQRIMHIRLELCRRYVCEYVCI